MKLSEFPPIGWHERRLWTLTADGKPDKPTGRVEDFAHFIRSKGLDRYGDWNIRDVSVGSCCRGTVVASLSSKAGRVEFWNDRSVYYIPKGVKPSDEPYPRCIQEDMENGIRWWSELQWKPGMSIAEMNARLVECVAAACASAGIAERLPLTC